MESINTHEIYGRRMTEHSLHPIARGFILQLRRASVIEIDDAIRTIQGEDATEKTSCSTLSTVVCLLTQPNELSRLRNTGILSACINLLRTYGNRTRGKVHSLFMLIVMFVLISNE